MTLTEQMYSDLQSQLPALQEALKTGAEWGSDLAGRYIVYDIAYNIFEIFAFCLIMYILYRAWKHFGKRYKDDDCDELAYVGLMFVSAISILIGVLSFMVIFCNIEEIFKDIFIPEIRIIELLSTLIQ